MVHSVRLGKAAHHMLGHGRLDLLQQLAKDLAEHQQAGQGRIVACMPRTPVPKSGRRRSRWSVREPCSYS